MQPMQLFITEPQLRELEGDFSWCIWLLVLLSGFLSGAIAALSALWLFAHRMHH